MTDVECVAFELHYAQRHRPVFSKIEGTGLDEVTYWLALGSLKTKLQKVLETAYAKSGGGTT